MKSFFQNNQLVKFTKRFVFLYKPVDYSVDGQAYANSGENYFL